MAKKELPIIKKTESGLPVLSYPSSKEEISTSVSQTPAQPSTESGASIEPQPIAQVQGGEIQDNYILNGSPITKEDLQLKISDKDFVDGLISGDTSLTINNDPELQTVIQNAVEAKQKKDSGGIISDFFIKSYDVMANQLPSAWAAWKALELPTVGEAFKMPAEDLKYLPKEYRASDVINKEAAIEANKNLKNELLNYAQSKQLESGELSELTVNTISEIQDPIDAIRWLTGTMGETVSQIAPTVMTGGGTSIVQEVGSIYLDGVLSKAEELNKTPEDVIREGLDDTETAKAFGYAAAMLDRVGAGSVVSSIGKRAFRDGLVKRTIPTLKAIAKSPSLQEGVTEGIQTILEQVGTNVSADKKIEIDIADVLEASAKGFVGSKGITITSNYLKNSAVTKDNVEELNEISKYPEKLQSIKDDINDRVEAGDITQEQADKSISELELDVNANLEIPEKIQGEDRVKAIELQRKYNEVKQSQEQASEVFKPLYKAELDDLSKQLQELALKKPQESKGITLQEKKDEIEGGRQEELQNVNNAIAKSEQTGEVPTVNGNLVNKKTIDEINDNYDAKYVDAVNKGEITKEQAMQALEDVGRKESAAYAEIAALEGAQEKSVQQKEAKDIDNYEDIFKKTPLTDRVSFIEEQSKKLSDTYITKSFVNDSEVKETVFHGSAKSFNEFDENFLGKNTGAVSAKSGFFFTNNPDIADDYAQTASEKTTLSKDELKRKNQIESDIFFGKGEVAEKYNSDKNFKRQIDDEYKSFVEKNKSNKGMVKPYKLNLKNPKIIDMKGSPRKRGDFVSIINKAKKEGKDGVVIKNTYDSPVQSEIQTDIYVVFDKKNILDLTKQETDAIQEQPTDEQFDAALEILEPIASERRELTLEELENVYTALGENADQVFDISRKDKNAVDLYNELTDKKNAKEARRVRKKGEQVQAEETGVGDMREIDQIETTQEEKEVGSKMRGFAKSAQKAFTGLKDRIQKNPENYYEPQKWATMKGRISEMTEEELIQNMDEKGLNVVKDGDENNSILAGIELINRRIADDKPIDDLVERFAKEGTKMGQLIAQFKDLNSSTPFGIMSTINKIAERKGKILSPQQKKNIQDLAQEMLKAVNKLQQHIQEKGGKATNEDIKTLKKLNKEAESKSREFYKFVAPFTPMTWSEMLQMSIQGNLITLGSQVTNVVANVGQQTILTPVNSVASLADLMSSIFTKKRVGSFDPRQFGYAWLGRYEYLKKAIKKIVFGDTSYVKGEVKNSFDPLNAAVQSLSETKVGDLIGIPQGLIPKSISENQQERLREAKKLESDGDVEAANKIRQEVLDSAKISLSDRLKKVYESTVGVPVEIMFRLLSLGDEPFRGGEIYRQRFIAAKRKGLKGDDIRRFVLMPDAKTQEEINESSKEVVFQEDGVISKMAQKSTSAIKNVAQGIKYIDPVVQFIFRLNVPFVKTPSNIVSQLIDYTLPPVALAKAAYYYIKGDQRQGNRNVGVAATGYMMIAAAEFLVANGLVSAAIDWGDEDDKNIKMKVTGSNSLNITGLKRALEGGNPEYKETDDLIDISKFGIPGAAILIRAERARNKIRDKRVKAANVDNDETFLESMINLLGIETLPEVIQFSFEQSFLAGTSTLLEAFKGGEYEAKRWFKQMTSAASAIVLPNTLGQLNRATETYLPDTRVESLPDAINALITSKIGFAVGENYPEFPIRVDMWGDPIRRTPEGKNPYFYQFFDITKSREVPKDQLSLEIYQLYKLTQNPKVVPNMPSRIYFDDGIKYEIPKSIDGNKLYNEYASKVQKIKRKYAESEFKKSSYKNSSIEKRVERMSNALSKYQNSFEYKKARKELIKTLKSKKFD